jgi:nucleoside-diphosphate-sugar epimerase
MTPAYLPKRIALTGGTGALGFAFLRELFAHQPEVRATLLVRRASASFAAAPFQAWLVRHEDRVKLIDCDLCALNKTQTDALVRTDGGLWHFAAVTSLNATDEDVARQINEVNIEGTRHLAEACQRSGRKHPFFHISTAYVLGHRTGTIREDDRAVGQEFRNPYEASKSAAEDIVQRAFAAGVPGAIFRPSVVVDDAGGTGGFKIVDTCAFAVALAVKRNEPFVFRLPDSAGINLVHSDWVIAAMLDLARMPSGPGRTYHLTAPESTRFRDIGGILNRLVPNLTMQFEPDFQRSDLPDASKLFDKAAAELRPYFEAQIQFDRTHAARDLSPPLRKPALKLKPFVELRLRAEMDRVAARQAARTGAVVKQAAG